MRTLFSIVLVLAICLVAVGFYRGWFAFQTTHPDPASNNVNVEMKIDAEKMQADADKVKAKAEEMTEQVSPARPPETTNPEPTPTTVAP